MTRHLVMLAATALAGCGSSPQSLGITGPGAAPVEAPALDNSTLPPPGISNTGGGYRYNVGPLDQQEERYFNYN